MDEDLILSPQAVEYCLMKFRKGEYSQPSSWPEEPTESYVTEELEPGWRIDFPSPPTVSVVHEPDPSVLRRAEDAKHRIEGFEYLWLRAYHPELLKYCASKSELVVPFSEPPAEPIVVAAVGCLTPILIGLGLILWWVGTGTVLAVACPLAILLFAAVASMRADRKERRLLQLKREDAARINSARLDKLKLRMSSVMQGEPSLPT